jgi:hypothetical protein
MNFVAVLSHGFAPLVWECASVAEKTVRRGERSAASGERRRW